MAEVFEGGDDEASEVEEFPTDEGYFAPTGEGRALAIEADRYGDNEPHQGNEAQPIP